MVLSPRIVSVLVFSDSFGCSVKFSVPPTNSPVPPTRVLPRRLISVLDWKLAVPPKVNPIKLPVRKILPPTPGIFCVIPISVTPGSPGSRRNASPSIVILRFPEEIPLTSPRYNASVAKVEPLIPVVAMKC